MIYSTPPEDWDPLAEAPPLLEAIRANLEGSRAFANLTDESPPGLYASYLSVAADLARQLVLALQTAAGRAQRQVEEAARQRGLEECSGGCHRWLPQAQVIRRSTGGKERSSHYFTCVGCGGPGPYDFSEENP